MSVPQILYRLHWTDADGEQYTVHGVHAAVSALEAVLVDAGATSIQIDVPERRQGRHVRTPVDEPLYGAAADRVRDELAWHPRTPEDLARSQEESRADELDAGDRRALGRLGRKAFGLEGE